MKKKYKTRHYKNDDMIYDIGYRESELAEELYKQCKTEEDEDSVDDIVDSPPHVANYLLKWRETHWDEAPWAAPGITEDDSTDMKYQLNFEKEHIEKHKTNELII